MLWKKSRRTFLGEKNQMFLNDKNPPKQILHILWKKTHIHTFWLASLSVRVRIGVMIWWLWETKVVGFDPFIGFADINITIAFHLYFKVTSVNDVTFYYICLRSHFLCYTTICPLVCFFASHTVTHIQLW